MDSLELESIIECNNKLDLLNRQEFVDQLSHIAKTLAQNRKSACYAINGSWGSGKTFVLDMFEEAANREGQEDEILNQYVVFRYNCWEYDYYEEPIIAIVAAILEQYEKKCNFLSSNQKEEIKTALQKIGKALLAVSNQALKDKTGLDATYFVELVSEASTEANTKIEKNHAYDHLYNFKGVLKALQQKMAELSEHQALLIIVDELDRCLPEYTIKVLERLHHLFDGIPNVQIILAIDKEQLKHTVKQIYGYGINVNKYLEKFIDFEIKLTVGSFNENVDAVFEDYFRYFEYKDKKTLPIEVDEFKSMIREGIDIRTSLAIYKKCKLVHELLNSEKENSDYSIMCVEVFLALLKYCGLDIKKAKGCFDISNVFLTSDAFQDGGIEFPIKGFYLLNRKLNEKNLKVLYYTFYKNQHHIRADNIWGLLLASYRLILGFDDDWYTGSYEKSRIEAYTSKFWKFLQTIS